MGRKLTLSPYILFSQHIITNANPVAAKASFEYIKVKPLISTGVREESKRGKSHQVIQLVGAVLCLEMQKRETYA